MKVTFKWDGKDAYTPKFHFVTTNNINDFYVGIPISQEKESVDGVLWIADDVIHNFESVSIEGDLLIFKTTHNAFIFKSYEMINDLPKGEICTGVVYLDENNEYIPRSYRKIRFNNV